MQIHVLVLNYNGRRLLAECLPTVVRAAERSRYDCEVIVIDNDSHDESVAWVAENFPKVRVLQRLNRGLCSFNEVLPKLSGPVTLLLNNDVKLHAGCIDPLVHPLLNDPECFMTAPLCWQFDGKTYEGFRTAVRWRWGLVQATALYHGYRTTMKQPGWTASAGAVMAVDRQKFLDLGGFDPVYLPGRIEDLDLCYRAFQSGYHCLYVPQAVALHKGMVSFRGAFGQEGCDLLALRNTLLFQWKNLRHPLHIVRLLACLPVRLVWDVLRAVKVGKKERFALIRAIVGAFLRNRELTGSRYRTRTNLKREAEFFRRFSPRRMRKLNDDNTTTTPGALAGKPASKQDKTVRA